MEELEVIKLKPLQEVQNINIEPADNGGCVLRFTIHTPSKTYSESNYDNRVELFDEDEIESALDRIRDLYKANIEGKKTKKSGTAEPMKG